MLYIEALLDPARKAPKVYEVDVEPRPSDRAIAKLAQGVVITTTQQRTMVGAGCTSVELQNLNPKP